jgi:hypothetical protein
VTEIRQERRSLMTDLRRALAGGRHHYARGRQLQLGELLDSLGNSGAPVTALVLALPFVSPLSLGPVTMPVSVMILLIGIHLMRGRERFPVPARFLSIPLPQGIFRLMRRVIAALSRWFRWHMVPVSPATIDGGRDTFRLACAAGILFGALLLAVPIPFIPLTNTFPALAIIAFCVAYLRRGHKEFYWGMAFTTAALLVFAIYGFIVYTLGMEGLQTLMGRRTTA